MPVCHESELPDPYSFRTMTVAREPVMVVRGADNQIRAFLMFAHIAETCSKTDRLDRSKQRLPERLST
jgi:hypothetical protein